MEQIPFIIICVYYRPKRGACKGAAGDILMTCWICFAQHGSMAGKLSFGAIKNRDDGWYSQPFSFFIQWAVR
jgi:hypothetical protein